MGAGQGAQGAWHRGPGHGRTSAGRAAGAARRRSRRPGAAGAGEGAGAGGQLGGCRGCSMTGVRRVSTTAHLYRVLHRKLSVPRGMIIPTPRKHRHYKHRRPPVQRLLAFTVLQRLATWPRSTSPHAEAPSVPVQLCRPCPHAQQVQPLPPGIAYRRRAALGTTLATVAYSSSSLSRTSARSSAATASKSPSVTTTCRPSVRHQQHGHVCHSHASERPVQESF